MHTMLLKKYTSSCFLVSCIRGVNLISYVFIPLDYIISNKKRCKHKHAVLNTHIFFSSQREI